MKLDRRENVQKGIEKYDEISKQSQKVLSDLVNSSQANSSPQQTVSSLPTTQNKSHFTLTYSKENQFTFNLYNPQLQAIKDTMMTFRN